MKVFTQCNPPSAESEVVDKKDVITLDKTSLTSVVEFMRKFQSDASFTPPISHVEFDSAKYNLDIDTDVEFPSLYNEVEDLMEEDSSVSRD